MTIREGTSLFVLGSIGHSTTCNFRSQCVRHLVWTAQSSTQVFACIVSMQLHELGDVKLGFLQDLDLADQSIFQWENALTLLLNLLANGFGNEFFHELSKLNLACLRSHNLDHFDADLADLRCLCIAIVFDLLLTL